jgi:hypothetical protein
MCYKPVISHTWFRLSKLDPLPSLNSDRFGDRFASELSYDSHQFQDSFKRIARARRYEHAPIARGDTPLPPDRVWNGLDMGSNPGAQLAFETGVVSEAGVPYDFGFLPKRSHHKRRAA